MPMVEWSSSVGSNETVLQTLNVLLCKVAAAPKASKLYHVFGAKTAPSSAANYDSIRAIVSYGDMGGCKVSSICCMFLVQD